MLAALGLVLAITVIFTVGTAMHSLPVILKQPEGAQTCAEKLMHAVCSGDYDTVSQCLQGNPDFTVPKELDNPAADLMWDAYRRSFTYRFLTDTYADDTGLAIDVAITCLDLSAVLESTQKHAQTILKHRVARAEDAAEIYDENQHFREELLVEVMRNATVEALQEHADRREVTALTLHMLYEQGQWWVAADVELLQILSGDIVLLNKNDTK